MLDKIGQNCSIDLQSCSESAPNFSEKTNTFRWFGLGVQFSERLDFGVNFENAQNVRRAERF